FPEVKIPTIYVGTAHPGNSPVDIENLITRPIEKELNTVDGVDKIKSVSVQDYSTIIVEFETDVDVSDALQKAKDAVDKAKNELPTDLKNDPNVFELDFSEFPILNINLSGDYSLDELNEYAEYLEDEIEKFPEISKAEIRGVDEKEVRIKVDPYKLEARMVSFGDIESAVTAENLTLSGGSFVSDNVRRDIRVIGEVSRPEQLAEIVVKHENNNIVYLKDIASVEFGYKEKESFARLDGKPVVMLDVVKKSGENLIVATEKIKALLEKAQVEEFPQDLVITVTNDQSRQTKDNVSSLENNIISGVILVVLILLFFLGTRNALFVGIAIPMSMFMSFLILGALGISINMMVLFALIMALGMLVDNGIVVVENVYRLMEEGYSALEATRRGVGEVALPIISSTATTLAAFLPLAIWPGLMGQFMKYLPITLIITLGSSLFVALVITPVVIRTFMKVEEGKVTPSRKTIIRSAIAIVVGFLFVLTPLPTWFGNLLVLMGSLVLLDIYVLVPIANRFQESFLPWLDSLYERTLRSAIRGKRPYAYFFGTVGALIFSIVLLAVFAPKVLFFPMNEPAYANVFIEFPVGTDIEKTNEFTREIEQRVFEVIEPYRSVIESVVTNVGQGTADPNSGEVSQGNTPHKARITANFVEFKYRNGVMTSDVLNEIREGIQGYPGVTITVDKDAAGPPVGKPISIELSGDNYATLIEITERMKTHINNSGIQGIEKLKTDLETGKPELIVNIDREKARRFGLSTYSVANEIRTALFGREISKFKKGEDDYEITIRLDDAYRYDIEALINKSITYRDQSSGKLVQIPISSVARAEYSTTYGSVRRKDLKRMVTLSSNVLDGYNPTEINQKIKTVLADFKMPAGYDFKFGGEQEEQAKEMAFLSRALLLAVAMIFLIIVSQFNKLSAPFIIMTSVVFSTIGVFLGLVIFQMDFIIIMTMIGIISLAGIVVNNAIVLIDFIELIRARKQEELEPGQAITKEEMQEIITLAGKTRLRPVLLTAITTVLGLIPLAVGINIDFIGLFTAYRPDFYIGGDNVIFWGPMSWTIIFGLSFATFLTLVIVPVMYLMAWNLKNWLILNAKRF
ncbi:MAG: efflux RND transporter permease subunit, partial [Cytophagales bacterium]|nr:efflux RND transporter permease subunit [Cytophagales bacterium]